MFESAKWRPCPNVTCPFCSHEAVERIIPDNYEEFIETVYHCKICDMEWYRDE